MAADLSSSAIFLLLFFPLLLIFLLAKQRPTPKRSPSSSSSLVPKSYIFIGSLFSIYSNHHRRTQWTSDIIQTLPNATFVLHRWFGQRHVFTANPAVVQHILKTHFHNYQKGDIFRKTLRDFLGNGIFNADGVDWKFQRHVSSHQFNTKSLKKFVETVVETELSDRLIPILLQASETDNGDGVLDLQDVLQRFAFDNICKIAFGYDPSYLLPSFPQSEFARAYDDGVFIISGRFNAVVPLLWKLKKFFNVGSERRLREVVNEIRTYAKNIIEEKKRELKETASIQSDDLLSRFLSSGYSDEDFVIDIVISFILAGKDTTSAALTWFFWLLAKYPDEEKKILEEINEKVSVGSSRKPSIYDEAKDMVYTHAALCESMRLYPPVPVDTKSAVVDDVLPDGTAVKKGTKVAYHPYAMGRSEKLWGPDWAVFRPERWLEKTGQEGEVGKWRFVGKDTYVYPVFQAGPRVCLGKEMAFLQMKRVAAGILQQFRVLPVNGGDRSEPRLVQYLTTKMVGGFSVRIMKRSNNIM